ncbi:MAG: hypothetical protein RLZZ01_2316 [Actinomycetota bacterium]|jgi:hypothetical protein
MIKVMSGLLFASGLVLGVSSIAAAYPPENPTVTVSNLSPIPGGPVTVTYDGCEAGDTATFTLGDQSVTAEVVDGVASADLTAPVLPGAAAGSVACSSGATGDFEIDVQASPLPATGGAGVDAKGAAAGAMLLVGAGLLGVSQIRRRRTVVA